MLTLDTEFCYTECRVLYHYIDCHQAIMQSVMFLCCNAEHFYAECHYAECHYAEWHYAECRYTECRCT